MDRAAPATVGTNVCVYVTETCQNNNFETYFVFFKLQYFKWNWAFEKIEILHLFH